MNVGKRDSNDSRLNRLSLRIQYLLADHIFVHTLRMQQELVAEFGISVAKVSIVRFGINNTVPHTALTDVEAKRRLGITQWHKALGSCLILRFPCGAARNVLSEDSEYGASAQTSAAF